MLGNPTAGMLLFWMLLDIEVLEFQTTTVPLILTPAEGLGGGAFGPQ